MEQDKKQAFFDTHLHAFNASHPGLIAFLNRFLLNSRVSIDDLLQGRVLKICYNLFRKPGQRLWILLLWVLILLLACWGVSSFFNNLTGWLLFAFLVVAVAVLLIRFTSEKISKHLEKLVGLLSVSDNDLGRQLRFIELDYLYLDTNVRKSIDRYRKPYRKYFNPKRFFYAVQSRWKKAGQEFQVGGMQFGKVILTPLIMDFGYKAYDNLNPDLIHYNIPPRKQTSEQAVDLFDGIKDYRSGFNFGLLEIYPFLGITPANYPIGTYHIVRCPSLNTSLPASLRGKARYDAVTGLLVLEGWLHKKDIAALAAVSTNANEQRQIIKLAYAFDKHVGKDQRDWNSLARMLCKFFGEYDRVYFRQNHEKNFPKWSSFHDVESNFFCGIKLYPPLGFDPWPEGNPLELKKVELLYRFCERKNVPITVHCGGNGFVTVKEEENREFTSPKKWMPVLAKYKKLRLNLAHFGLQAKTTRVWVQWLETIIELINKYDYAYTDLACVGNIDENYKFLKDRITSYCSIKGISPQKIYEKLLFGTDFPVNLLGVDSYYHYLQVFSDTTAFDQNQKKGFCVDNPYAFLFKP